MPMTPPRASTGWRTWWQTVDDPRSLAGLFRRANPADTQCYCPQILPDPPGDRSACPDAQAPLNQDVPPSAPMYNISAPSKDPVRRAAIVTLATVHVLGILGAPF